MSDIPEIDYSTTQEVDGKHYPLAPEGVRVYRNGAGFYDGAIRYPPGTFGPGSAPVPIGDSETARMYANRKHEQTREAIEQGIIDAVLAKGGDVSGIAGAVGHGARALWSSIVLNEAANAQARRQTFRDLAVMSGAVADPRSSSGQASDGGIELRINGSDALDAVKLLLQRGRDAEQ